MYLETHQCAYCRTEKNAAQPSYLSRVHRKRLHGGLIFYEIECSCLISGSFLVHLEILENISKNGGKKRNYLTWFYFYFCTLKKCPSKFFYLFLHSPHGVYFSKWFYVPFPRPSYELDYYDVVVYVVSFKEFERHA